MSVIGEAFVAIKPQLDSFAGIGDKVRDSLPDPASTGSGFGTKLMSGIGAGLLAGGTIAAGAFAAGFSGAMDRIDLESDLQRGMGLDADQTRELGRVAASSYTSGFGDTLADSFESLQVVASQFGASLPTDQLQQLNSTAMVVADTFGVDIEAAVSTAGVALNSGLASDAEEGMDLVVAALQKVPVAMRGDLLDAVTEYGPMLSQLGYEGEEAFGLLASAAQSGQFSLDKTGDALKEFTIRATDMSTTSVDAYKTLGLSAEDMSASILRGGDDAKGATDQIIDALLAIEDPVVQANTAIALFGTPLEDLSTGEIPDFLAGLDDMGTSLGDVSSASEDLTAAAAGPFQPLENLKRQIMVGLAEAVRVIIPPLSEFASYLAENLPGAIDALRPTFDRIVGTLSDFGDALVDLGGFVADNRDIFEALGIALGIAGGAWLAYQGYLLAVSGVSKAFKAVQAALNFVMAANPIVLVVAALAALAAGLYIAYRRSETFRDIVDSIGRFLRDEVMPVLSDVGSVLADVFVRGFELARSIVGEVMEIVGGFVDVVSGMIDMVVGVFTGDWQRVWDGARETITGFVDIVTGYFIELPAAIGGVLLDLGQTLIGAFTDAFVDLVSALPGIVVQLLTWYAQLYLLILEVLADAGMWLVDVGVDAMTGLYDGVISFFSDTIVPWLAGLGTLIFDTIGDLISTLTSTGIDLITGLYDAVVDFWLGTVAPWFIGLGVRAFEAIGDITRAIYQRGRDMLSGLFDSVVQGWINIGTWFAELGVRAFNAIGDVTRSLMQRGFDMLRGLLSAIVQGGAEVLLYFMRLPGAIVDAIGDVAGRMLRVGADIIRGIVRGIRNGAGAVFDAVMDAIPSPGDIAGGIRSGVSRLNPFNHGGGVVGVDTPQLMGRGPRGDEYWRILQRGETVFTRGQMEMLGGLLRGGGPSQQQLVAPQVIVQIGSVGGDEQAAQRVASLTGAAVAKVFTSRYLAVDSRSSR